MIKIVIPIIMILALITPSQGGLTRFDYSPAHSRSHLAPAAETAAVVHADIQQADPDFQSKPDTGTPGILSFRTINGIDMNWNKDQLVQQAGYPNNWKVDKILGTVELSYPTTTVGIYDGQIGYVIVPADQPSMTINGSAVPLTLASLRHKLGQPDYVAEDGIVYEREDLCLKLFYKEGSARKKLDSVQIFWSAEV
jgi:hypothetical protein